MIDRTVFDISMNRLIFGGQGTVREQTGLEGTASERESELQAEEGS